MSSVAYNRRTGPRILVEGGPVHRRVNHTLAGLLGFVLGVAVGFVIVIGLIHRSVGLIHKSSVRECQEIELVKTDLRAIIGEANRFTATSPVRSRQEKLNSATFYRDALGRLKAGDC